MAARRALSSRRFPRRRSGLRPVAAPPRALVSRGRSRRRSCPGVPGYERRSSSPFGPRTKVLTSPLAVRSVFIRTIWTALAGTTGLGWASTTTRYRGDSESTGPSSAGFPAATGRRAPVLPLRPQENRGSLFGGLHPCERPAVPAFRVVPQPSGLLVAVLLQRTSSRAVPPSVPSAAMVGGTVLVVEHETPVRAYLEQQLADDGFEVLATDRATAALELVEQARPSLVLLDAILPDASGFEVCSRLREGEPGRAWDRDVPVIMVSARGDPVDRVRGFARGCDDYVVRPSFALLGPIPL